jgi:hypothetical protein
MTAVSVGTLAPGTAFITAETKREGTVVYQSPGGTSVRYGGPKTKRFTAKTVDGDKEVEFDAPGRSVVISAGTQVLTTESLL